MGRIWHPVALRIRFSGNWSSGAALFVRLFVFESLKRPMQIKGRGREDGVGLIIAIIVLAICVGGC